MWYIRGCDSQQRLLSKHVLDEGISIGTIRHVVSDTTKHFNENF